MAIFEEKHNSSTQKQHMYPTNGQAQILDNE